MGKKADRRAAKRARNTPPLPAAESRLRIALGSTIHPDPAPSPWQIAKPAPGVVPEGASSMAMDEGLGSFYAGYASQSSWGLAGGSDMAWLGYPFLAELAQRSEYRRISETFSKEMTRKWIKLQAVGDDDKTDRIKTLEDAMTHYNVQHVFRRACEIDGFFGRGQIYIDTGTSDDDTEQRTNLALNPAKIPRNSLKHLTVLEPVWTYPGPFNSANPLRHDFYRPQMWYVMGQNVHVSRLLTLVGREVPDMLRPAYAFGGLSLTQIARPYVENWLRTRQSVSDMIHSFSTSGIKTNMTAELTGADDEQIMRRAHMFNQMRDNRGLLMLDKELEEFFNVSAPLGTLDKLQAQSQEQIASAIGIPLLILLGISPSGLNATAEPELKSFYNWIEAQQEQLFTVPLKRVIDIIQLSVFGDIDPAISFRYESLWGLDETAKAALRKTDCDADVAYLNAGVLAPIEVRKRIANDENSLYPGLDVEDVPPPPGGMGAGGPPNGESEPGSIADLLQEALGGGAQPDIATPLRTALTPVTPATKTNIIPLLRSAVVGDKEFDESKIKRGQPENAGEFAKSAGATGVKQTVKPGVKRSNTAAPKAVRKRQDENYAQTAGGGYEPAPAAVAGGKTPRGKSIPRTNLDGSPLPEHIRKLAIPPAWTDVRYNPDPNGRLLATGRDASGKLQPKYNPTHAEETTAQKFERIGRLMQDFPAIQAKNEAAKQDPKTADLAEALDLVMKMGIRPGSNADTKAKKKAYGATTLQGRHVVTDPDGTVRLDFDAKDGVHMNLPVTDPALAKRLQARAAAAGAGGNIFGQVHDKSLLAHAHAVGGEYKVKDYRTRLGTASAHSMVANMTTPETAAERATAIMDVAKRVSAILGNTPIIARNDYIAPSVFAHWMGGAKI